MPSRGFLGHIPEAVQEKVNYSGAAIGSVIRNLHGEHVEQSDLREMVDFAMNHSGYEPFQAWRIILRRVLTSNATKVSELPEYQKFSKLEDE